LKVSSLWIALAGLSLAFPAIAEQPEAGIPVIGETIDVRVVNVEAVVTAPSGQRVPGLSTADFHLLVDGREVPVEYFAEITEGKSVQADKAPVAAGEAVGRNYLIYLDDSFSLANRRNDILGKLERDLALLGPADRMAILAFDGARLSVLCPWTGDAKTLRDALAVARQRPALGAEMLAHQRKLQRDVDWVLDNKDSIEDYAANIEAMSHRISGEARSQLGKTADAAAAALRGFETPPGRKVMLMLSGAWSLSVAARLYGPVVQAANQLGYTVYPVEASQSDATEDTGLDLLARATGGRLLIPANDAVFREAAADSGTYYWLGFTPAWKADDRGHSVTVEVRRPGLAVRSRNGFSDLSRTTEAAMKAESVLLFGGKTDDRRLLVTLGEPVRRSGAFEIPVTLGVPVEALALTAKGKGYFAVLPLAISTEEADGRRANLSGPHLKVQIAALPQAGTYARFQTVVRLRDPKQRLIFSIHDAVSGHALWGQAQLASTNRQRSREKEEP
jgi:VWFA-related protein